MQLTPAGLQILKSSYSNRLAVVKKLLGGGETVTKYTRGVCYDAAAFIKYLLRIGGSPDIFVDMVVSKFDVYVGQAWQGDLTIGKQEWVHGQPITAGSVVTFYRAVDSKFFHAAISTGGTTIRAVNGGFLGAGWVDEVDLAVKIERSADGTCRYDRTGVNVYIQSPMSVPA